MRALIRTAAAALVAATALPHAGASHTAVLQGG